MKTYRLKNKTRLTIIIAMSIISLSATVFGQSINSHTSYKKLKSELLKYADNIINYSDKSHKKIVPEILIKQIINSCETKPINKNELINAEIEDLKKAKGFAFESGIGYQDGLDSDQETDAYIGITWDFLNNGLREISAKEKKLKAELKKNLKLSLKKTIF